ncbi:NAD-dependent epimerase/dehydratase family protein [Thermodesulfobacteriota bacterium]
MKALVSGGAGFIGSHLVDELIRRGWEVIIYDNLSTGFMEHLEGALGTGQASLIDGDILNESALAGAMQGVKTVFHLAANADVRGGITNTRVDLAQNLIGTHKVLEVMRATGTPEIVFTSSATVYGEPVQFPTPETYAPLQTSVYGASKLSAEAYIQAYGEYFGIRSHIFRFVSWVGERYSHGVVYDFMNKLRKDPHNLEILGDGNQRKSYLHVEDGIRGIFLALEKIREQKNVINLGHENCLSVKEVAGIICDEMGLKDVEFHYTGGSRGWLGDSPFVHLDITKVKDAGFRPEVSIEDGLRRTVRYLLANTWLLEGRGA